MEQQELITIIHSIRHAHDANATPAIRAWAIQCGKRALLTWSIIRQQL
jgi:hypothetical protein